MGGSPDTKKVVDDETSSNASFEEVSQTVEDLLKVEEKDEKPVEQGKDEYPKVHKIEGKVPPVLYVLQYLGFANKVVESELPSPRQTPPLEHS